MITIVTLEEVVTRCGKLVQSLHKGAMDEADKEEQLGAHFSTCADRQSQELGIQILRGASLDTAIIAEEQQNELSIPRNCVVFDPLDGTTNYFNGSDIYGVTACTFGAGLPVMAATYFPARDQLISAVYSHGCYIGGFERGRRIVNIPWHGKVDKAMIGTDIGPWAETHGTFDTILRPLAKRFTIKSEMAAVEGMRSVLLGHTATYFNLGVAKIWDCAAMALCIEEAGGIVCNPYGNPLSWDKIDCDWIAAGSREMADVILEHSRNWPGRQ